MAALNESHQESEVSQDDFSREYTFEADGGFTKIVEVTRAGNFFVVTIKYTDIAVMDETHESFEANGEATIKTTDNGVYIISSRLLLSGRIRLKRTRFF